MQQRSHNPKKVEGNVNDHRDDRDRNDQDGAGDERNTDRGLEVALAQLTPQILDCDHKALGRHIGALGVAVDLLHALSSQKEGLCETIKRSLSRDR